MYLYALRVSACIAFVIGCATAGQTSIRGELKSENVLATNLSLTIELVNLQDRTVVGRQVPSAAGGFEFNSVPDGQYEVRAVNSYGDVIRSEYVTAAGAVNFVSIRLPETKIERPVSGTVSVSTLQHQVPKNAQKEFVKSEQEMKSGRVEKSIEHLEKAVAIDPEFMQAHNNLGSRYHTIKSYVKAAAEFQKAEALDPHSEMVESNLAVALVSAKDFVGGERAARRALELGHSRKACLALGISLSQQWRQTSEAIEHLMHAATDYPRARVIMAELFLREGQSERATDQLRQYLAAAKGSDRESVSNWLADIEHETKTLAQARH